MVTISVLHESIAAYVKDEKKHFELLSGTTDLARFEKSIEMDSPQVLLLDVGLLGTDPVAKVRELERKACSGARDAAACGVLYRRAVNPSSGNQERGGLRMPQSCFRYHHFAESV